MLHKNRLIISIILFLLFVLGTYALLKGSYVEKAGQAPSPGTNSSPSHSLPGEQNALPAEKKVERIESNSTSQTVRMERPTDPLQPSNGDPVNLEEHSMSLKKPNRDIAVTPGVVFHPGEGISLKTSDKEETIRVKRDNTYRSGEYKVMLERKY